MEVSDNDESEDYHDPSEPYIPDSSRDNSNKKKKNSLIDLEKSPQISAARKLIAIKEEKRLQKTKEEQKTLLKELQMSSEPLPLDFNGVDIEEKKRRRLLCLTQQSEVYSLYMQGVRSILKKKVEVVQKGRQRLGRMTEEEEDKQLLTSTKDRGFTRVNTQPTCIKGGEMKPYQIEALNWLISLYESGINGILADEMGLGKTLETLSMFGFLKEYRGIDGPHIIIAPKSTLGNWEKEINKWVPDFRVVRFQGDQSERNQIIKDVIIPRSFDILITSYEIANIEKSVLSRVSWFYLGIDEAHRIKNEASTLSKNVRLFKSYFRLLITGTPLQNNLHELWALLNFLLPDVFSNSDDFDQIFSMGVKDDFVKKLHTILRPFLLRRLKSDVAHDLPPKVETKLYIGLTELQKVWYKNVLLRDATALNQLGGASKVQLLNVLMQLRKVCNHPYLFEGAEPGPPFSDGPHLWESSGKMIILNKLLNRLKEQGSRVLLFSQMTRMLDILEDFMRYQGYCYCRIDGQTKSEDRDLPIDQFNAPDSPQLMFLLSTRAGGLGINLATADVVIIFDSDWNPQADLQAQDRCHRIGQKKQVRVFRFICEGTVEEKIVERAERKLYLDAVVIQQGRLAEQNQKLSKDELNTMITFGADMIFSSKGSTVTDEDIDAIIALGENKTRDFNEKIKKSMNHNLQNFSLDSKEEYSLYSFDGKNYKGGSFINLPQRERRNIYGETIPSRSNEKEKEKRRGFQMNDFQFYDEQRINELLDKEEELRTASEVDGTDGTASGLSPEEIEEKERLMKEGFANWVRSDFKKFLNLLEKYGRDSPKVITETATETGKTVEEVKAYYDTFWKKHSQLVDDKKIIDRIEKGEQRIERKAKTEAILLNRIMNNPDPLGTLVIPYGSQKGKYYTEDNDRFLLCMLAQVGIGHWDALKHEVMKTDRFRFDWYIKSRTTLELQKRCETLIRLMEKESDTNPKARKRPREEDDSEKLSTPTPNPTSPNNLIEH